MQDINLQAITTDPLALPCFTGRGITAAMLRLDKIHPLISGNKWFKLRYYLEEAQRLHKKRIVTFGGPWSNHIIATAAACRLQQLECTGIIRGEKPAVLSDTLKEAGALGMQLAFTRREDFAAQIVPAAWAGEDNYFIQQGGFGQPGVRGAAEILHHCADREKYTHICCAVGTGTMMAGLLSASLPRQKVVGVSVLKNNFQPEEDVKELTPGGNRNYSIIHDHHFGGYAKSSSELFRFMNDWYAQTGIPTDFVYTGKLCFAITHLAKNDFFPQGSRVLLIHSGGLTGNASLKKGTLIF